MSISGRFRPIPARRECATGGEILRQAAVAGADARVPLLNLSTVRAWMDSLQRYLSDSVNSNTLIGKEQMDMVSIEIAAAIHQIIMNGAAILACSQTPNPPPQLQPTLPKPKPSEISKIDDSVHEIALELDLTIPIPNLTTNMTEDKLRTDLKAEVIDEEMMSEVWEIVEMDAVELLAEDIHFCDICGKGFKRDANLRMHMRAHGNQFKTPEALAKPEKCVGSSHRKRFSCPYVGCNRHKLHKKFRPLKSAICLKNHFKRSHCPKMYSCNRCNKKSFSVVADLKSHLKHCGESKWKCSCGTSFSRKDKLFGHMALFEGHMPAVVEDDEKGKRAATMVVEDEEEDEPMVKDVVMGPTPVDDGFFDRLIEGFGSIENYCLQDVLGSPNSCLGTGVDGFYNL